MKDYTTLIWICATILLSVYVFCFIAYSFIFILKRKGLLYFRMKEEEEGKAN